MNYYQDITLIPGEEVPLYFLWEKVYQQLHLALVEKLENNQSKVGVAFPKYNQFGKSLCDKLRLLSLNEFDLQAINLDYYFSRLEDYVHKTNIKAVPIEKVTGYAFFKRQQIKGNDERLARRRARKLGVEYLDALAYFTDSATRKQSTSKFTNAPFVFLKSLTSGARFPLFIEMEQANKLSGTAEFSSYGLSSTSSVPLF